MSTMNKKNSRIKRARKSRAKIADSAIHRVSVYKSLQHIYLQLGTANGDKILTKACRPTITIVLCPLTGFKAINDQVLSPEEDLESAYPNLLLVVAADHKRSEAARSPK